MISVLKRPPHDTFTFRIFYRLLQKVKIPFDGIYLWSPVLYRGYDQGTTIDETSLLVQVDELYFRTQIFNGINEDLVIIGIKDHLSHGYFNPWLDAEPDLVQQLKEMFEFYSDKKFILLTSLENLESYVDNSNVKIVSWGGDITNQQSQYKSLKPVLDKNFDSQFNYISLNRNPRPHRLALVSLLYGMGLQNHGMISFICRFATGNLSWLFTKSQDHINKLILSGFEAFQHSDLVIKDSVDIYEKNDNGNVDNFVNKLRHYYKETFVEIVTETSYAESAFLITEKFLNSVYGCNFPIVLCSSGTVNFLRTIGFDMFDDIIDNSHDTIVDPVDRLYYAIYNNKRLLTDNDYVKDLWIRNKDRFEANVATAKSAMYEFFAKRAEEEFERCINEFNL